MCLAKLNCYCCFRQVAMQSLILQWIHTILLSNKQASGLYITACVFYTLSNPFHENKGRLNKIYSQLKILNSYFHLQSRFRFAVKTGVKTQTCWCLQIIHTGMWQQNIELFIFSILKCALDKQEMLFYHFRIWKRECCNIQTNANGTMWWCKKHC